MSVTTALPITYLYYLITCILIHHLHVYLEQSTFCTMSCDKTCPMCLPVCCHNPFRPPVPSRFRMCCFEQPVSPAHFCSFRPECCPIDWRHNNNHCTMLYKRAQDMPLFSSWKFHCVDLSCKFKSSHCKLCFTGVSGNISLIGILHFTFFIPNKCDSCAKNSL